MRNAMKVAKWEIKRNMKNKSFLIGLFLTPVLFFGFMFVGSLFGSGDEDATVTQVFVHDELGLFDTLSATADQYDYNWKMNLTDVKEADVKAELNSAEDTAYVYLDDRVFKDGTVPVYTSEEINPYFIDQLKALESPIQALKLKELGLTDEQLATLSQGVVFDEIVAESAEEVEASDNGVTDVDPMENLAPGIFAGIILLSIVFAGMYIFQSASQEKKDKIAEIILSSVTPDELMQGKIIGYFVLGIVQAVVFLAFALPYAVFQLDLPVFNYLFVPETLLLVLLAILGYLLFSSLFVGIGATMADISAAGQFQGMVMMLPFLPFIFIGPVISDPSGLVAQIGTYIPFTAPGVLILRLTLLDVWPWFEIGISLVILFISIWICMKLAGKIFKIGILMYGKNATPKEIWKWIRA